MPRWKSNMKIFLPEAEGLGGKEYVATVDVWHLGLGYNLQRMLGVAQQLYVFTN